MKNATAETMMTDVATLESLTQNTIYLMGMSFILGSLFTIFVLILLDFMKRDRVTAEVD